MKRLSLLTILLAVSVMSLAQHLRIDKETNSYRYDTIILDAGASKDVLMQRAKMFFATKYPEETMHIDSEMGKIIAIGTYQTPSTAFNLGGSTLKFKFDVDFKDGKYRFAIDDFTIYYNEVDGNFAPTGAIATNKLSPANGRLRVKFARRTDEHIRGVMRELALALSANNSTDDNW